MDSTFARARTFPMLRTLWTRPAIRRICFTLIVLLGIAQCVKSVLDITSIGMDFQQDYLAAQLMLAGDDIFRRFTPAEIAGIGIDPAQKTGMWQNAHPPTAIMLFLPFALVPFTVSAALWTVFTVLLLVLLILLLSRALGISVTRPQALLMSMGLLNWYPMAVHLQQGQWTVLLATLCVGALWCLQTERDEWAGILVGVAAVIKIYPVLLLAYGLWRWRPRFLLAGIATGIVLMAISLVAGVDNWVRYFTYTVPETYRVYHSSFNSPSLSNLAARLFAGNEEVAAVFPYPQAQTPARWLFLLIGVLATTLPFIRRSHNQDIVGEWFLLLCATSFLSPISWDHNLILFAPAFVLLWQRSRSALARYILFGMGMLSLFPSLYLVNWIRTAYEARNVPPTILLLETVRIIMIVVVVMLVTTLWRHRAPQKDVPYV